MREFFHGWKRKVGVLTLVIACVFAAGWIRSNSTTDILILESRDEIHEFELRSTHSFIALEWTAQGDPVPLKFQFGWPHLLSEANDPDSPESQRSFAFRCRSHRNKGGEFRRWELRIGYGWILLSLVVASTWLLLCKPRVAKPKTLSDSHFRHKT